MDTGTLLNIALALLIGGLVIAIAALLVRLVEYLLSKTRNVTLDYVLKGLDDWLKLAVFAGDHIALRGLDDANQVISGWDRQQVANAFYDLLPDLLKVPVRGTVIDVPIYLVKKLVSRADFYDLVENTYQKAHAFILEQENFLREKVQDTQFVQPPAPAKTPLVDSTATPPPNDVGAGHDRPAAPSPAAATPGLA